MVEVNYAVKENVQILADDPYTKGWLIKVKLDPSVHRPELLDYAATRRRSPKTPIERLPSAHLGVSEPDLVRCTDRLGRTVSASEPAIGS